MLPVLIIERQDEYSPGFGSSVTLESYIYLHVVFQHKSRYFQLIRVNPVIQVLNTRQKVNLFFYRGSGEGGEKPRDNSGPDGGVHNVECLEITAIPEEYKSICVRWLITNIKLLILNLLQISVFLNFPQIRLPSSSLQIF